MESSPFSETTTTTLEWKVSGLKKMFDGSKGEGKSKVVKSAKFGGGKWQILFYPNSGTDGGAHVSLYLSCEPTPEERERATNGKWEREGQFKFSFELRNVSKAVLFNSKEAFNHTFSYKTANWGWAQFNRRDVVYYQASSVKAADAFIIICVITSSAATPSTPASFPVQSVPRQLMDSIGDLLDAAIYSDIEFILPPPNKQRTLKRIYAMKPVLARTEYFDTMLNSGFLEDSAQPIDLQGQQLTVEVDSLDTPTTPSPFNTDDSDFEDESDEETGDTEASEEPESTPKLRIEDPPLPRTTPLPFSEGQDDFETLTNSENEGDAEGRVDDTANSNSAPTTRGVSPNESMTSWQTALIDHGEKQRDKSPARKDATPTPSQMQVLGPPKTKIVVKDVAYRTYYAMLYYLYTDNIVFAPLSSSFSSPAARTPLAPETQLPSSASVFRSEGLGGANLPKQVADGETTSPKPRTRKEWIKEWSASHPWHAEPCSAKSVYKLADKLDLHELKKRAYKHIVKSMTVENVPHEMFSSFSARFDEVRKIQIDFFLTHWAEIRGSEVMSNIWQQIRSGRHPGFEEVWPLIALNLEFKPSPPNDEGDDREHGLGDDGR